MEFSFKSSELENLYYQGRGEKDYPKPVIKAFSKKIQLIKYAKDERDIRNMKGNHFEKLEGRKDCYSIRLNDQYRLEFLMTNISPKEIIILSISNHYS